jgi:hypothetical protein
LIKIVKGSGGYIVADLTDEEVRRASLAGELFIGALGRIDDARIISYHCNNCSRDFNNAPRVVRKSVNELVAEGHVLIEQGEYICKECNAIIAIYKVFGEGISRRYDEDISIRDIVGSRVLYKQESIGIVSDVLVNVKSCSIALLVDHNGNYTNIPWESVEGIGNGVVLLKGKLCARCKYESMPIAEFCMECGNRLS